MESRHVNSYIDIPYNRKTAVAIAPCEQPFIPRVVTLGLRRNYVNRTFKMKIALISQDDARTIIELALPVMTQSWFSQTHQIANIRNFVFTHIVVFFFFVHCDVSKCEIRYQWAREDYISRLQT